MSVTGMDLIEKSLISIALNDQNRIPDILTNLDTSDFSINENKCIFAAIKELVESNSKVDSYIVINKLSNVDDPYVVNPSETITAISDLYTNSIDLFNYIKLIKNNSTSLKLKKFAQKMNEANFNLNNFEDEMWSVQEELQDILKNQKSDTLTHISTIVDNYREKIEIIKENHNKITGCSTGFKNIDEFTNGFQNGDLIILAARPSIGKTALALNMLLNVAKQCNEDEVVVMFSIEMAAEQLLQRLISCESGVDSRKINLGTWSDVDEYVVLDTINKISKLPILIDDNSNTSIMDIYNKLKQIKASNKKVKLIVVDYLQLVHGSNKVANNRQQEVSQISRTLKMIARDINAPVIAVAQLSRKIEERKGADRKPILSDLRESGSIEQDADLVTFLDYDRSQIDDKNSKEKSKRYIQNVEVDFIIAKHRNGSTGETMLLFQKSIGKYEDLK